MTGELEATDKLCTASSGDKGCSCRGSVTALLIRVRRGSPSAPATRGVVGRDPTRFACYNSRIKGVVDTHKGETGETGLG